MASIANVTVRFGVDLKQFTTKMQKATREIQAMGRQMQSTGRNLTRSLTLPILAAGGASLKLAADFDESMTKIQTLVGISSDKVEQFKEKVLSLSGQTAKAPAELADALFTVTSAGLRGAEALQVLEMSAKGSAIGMGETKEIARAVTAVMQAYGPEVMSAAQAMDMLTATVREGNLEAAELAPVLGRVVGVAAQLGVSFEEVGASVATFTRLGVDSSEAVTGLRGFLNALIKPSGEARDTLGQLRMTFADLRNEVDQKGLAQTMIKLINTFDGNVEALASIIPNVRALGAVMGTAGVQGKAYLEILNNIANSTGILDKGFNETSKSGAFKLKEALTSLKKVGTEIGSIVLPVVADLSEKLKTLFQRFSDLSKENKESVIKMLAFVAAVGPAVYVVGSLMASLGGLIKSFRVVTLFLAANPWLALAGAIGAVVVGIRGYNKINDAFGASSTRASKKLEEEKSSLNALLGVITDANISNDARARLLDDLVTKYPSFLGNLNKETVTNSELLGQLKLVNKEYEKKIIQQAAEEDTTILLKKRIDLQKEEAKLIQEKARIEKEGISGQPSVANVSPYKMLDAAINGVNKRLIDNKNAQQAVNEEYQKTLEFYSSLIPKTEELEEATVSLSEIDLIGVFEKEMDFLQGMRDEYDATIKKIVELGKERAALLESLLAEAEEWVSLDVLPDEEGTIQERKDEVEDFTSFTESAFLSLGRTFTNVFADMLTGAKVSIKGIINMLTGMIAKLIAAAAVAALLSALLPGFNTVSNKALNFGDRFKSMFKTFGGMRANGGPVSSGSGYIVGEKGPEWFQPNTSGSIIPNHALGGGSGGSMQLSIVGNVPITFQPNGNLTAILAQEQIRIKKLGG